MSNVTYKLSDRPKWWVPRVLKWSALLLLIVSIVTWISSIALYSFSSQKYDISGGENEVAQEFFSETIAYLLEETSVLLFESLFLVAFVWLFALAVDKIDQLVWLAASDEDREEILAKRQKKTTRK